MERLSLIVAPDDERSPLVYAPAGVDMFCVRTLEYPCKPGGFLSPLYVHELKDSSQYKTFRASLADYYDLKEAGMMVVAVLEDRSSFTVASLHELRIIAKLPPASLNRLEVFPSEDIKVRP
jgi:hypothetical protein